MGLLGTLYHFAALSHDVSPVVNKLDPHGVLKSPALSLSARGVICLEISGALDGAFLTCRTATDLRINPSWLIVSFWPSLYETPLLRNDCGLGYLLAVIVHLVRIDLAEVVDRVFVFIGNVDPIK